MQITTEGAESIRNPDHTTAFKAKLAIATLKGN
jgi:hypothetical protein